MSIQNKQVNIATDLNVNGNNIYDAKINANANTITNLAVNNFTSSAIKTSIADSTNALDTAIPTEKAVRSAVDGLLNEFIVTKEIFEKYANEYGFLDLNDLFNNYDLNNKIINLNGFNYLMNELTFTGSPWLRYKFKNGYICFDSVGVRYDNISQGCSQALTAEHCDLLFKDCRFDARNLYDSTKPVIALNDCFLEFYNCNIDALFISEKTFIETTDLNDIYINNTNVILSENSAYTYSGTDNNFSIVGIKTNDNGVGITASNAKIMIMNNSITGNFEPEHKFLTTAQDTTTRFTANSTEILVYGPGDKKQSLDINLDNRDMHIVNSVIDGNIYVRRESELEIEQNHTYNKGDLFYKFSDIFESWSDRHDIIDTITVTGTTFATAVDNVSDVYKFEYNGSNWELRGETVTLSDYGITYTLQSGKSLENGCNIYINFVYNAVLGFKVSANTFTPTSTDINYLDTCMQEDKIFRVSVESIYDFNNSIIINSVNPEAFFFGNRKGMFCVNRFLTNNIETDILTVYSEDYNIPINDENLSTNNVRDAIKELASRVAFLEQNN